MLVLDFVALAGFQFTNKRLFFVRRFFFLLTDLVNEALSLHLNTVLAVLNCFGEVGVALSHLLWHVPEQVPGGQAALPHRAQLIATFG